MNRPQLFVEWLSLPLLLDRRGRGMTRHRSYAAHTRYVLAQRPAFLAQHGGAIPAWHPPAGFRTTQPSERHSRPLGKD